MDCSFIADNVIDRGDNQMNQIQDIIVLILPLVLVFFGIYMRAKGKTTEQKIDIMLESLPDAKDKIQDIINKRKVKKK